MKMEKDIATQIIRYTPLRALIEFVKKAGIRFRNGTENSGIKITISYEKRNSEKLKKIYLGTENPFLKEVILGHPNCPEELKVAEEL